MPDVDATVLTSYDGGPAEDFALRCVGDLGSLAGWRKGVDGSGHRCQRTGDSARGAGRFMSGRRWSP